MMKKLVLFILLATTGCILEAIEPNDIIRARRDLLDSPEAIDWSDILSNSNLKEELQGSFRQCTDSCSLFSANRTASRQCQRQCLTDALEWANEIRDLERTL
ncbi:hypothetical protein HOM50_05510 [bacterium]|nr:hypothetical protein [bacterium]MBT5015836.1 hypothetical protein [bacterium]